MDLFACKPGPGWQLRPDPDFWIMVDGTYWFYILASLISCAMLVINRRFWYFPLVLFMGLPTHHLLMLSLDGDTACRSKNIGYYALASCMVGINIFASHAYLAFRPYWKADDPLSVKADYKD